MPNRILREGLLESSAIDLLDAEAERFFVRLMLRADDFGRYHANPAMLANMLFPLRRDIEPKQVADWLKQCQRAKLLRVYQVDGRPCLEIPKFGQRSRAQQSKFPDPPTDDGQMTDICLTDDRHPRTYSYSETYSKSKSETKTKGGARTADACPPLPVILETEEFKAAWEDYVTYRKQAKLRRLTPMSVRDQWAEMEGWGHDEAIEAVRTTIRKGWQGIFKPKHNGTHNGTNGAATGVRDRKELLYDGTGDW
jgi:hypothetical protein